MSKSRHERSQTTARTADALTCGESEQSEHEDVSAEAPAGDDERDANGRIEIETSDGDAEVDASDEQAGVAELESRIEELNGQLLRKQADFENFRKRMFREREDAVKSANAKLLLDLVDVIDNFERAIRSSEESHDFDLFHEGVELIEKQLVGMLENKWGLSRFESEGSEFDPERHEAIAVDQSGEYPAQTVVEDYQRGYLLHDRVLRHSKVRVSMPSEGEPEADEPRGTDDQDEQ